MEKQFRSYLNRKGYDPRHPETIKHLSLGVYIENNNGLIPDLTEFAGLKKLSLSGCHDTIIRPSEKSILPDSLELLEIENSALPEDLSWIYATNLKELVLNGIKYFGSTSTPSSLTLPNEIGQMSKLTKLSVSHYKLGPIPDSFKDLKNIIELELYDDCLFKVPEFITHLINLEHLSLRKNSIKELPIELFELRNLKELNLSYNKLEYIPDEIKNLVNLERLYLGNNELTRLPNGLTFLSELQRLTLDYNKLTRLPDEIYFLENLIEARFDNNKLEELPDLFIEQLSKVGIKKLNSYQLVSFKYNKFNKTADNKHYILSPSYMVKVREKGFNPVKR